VAHSLDASKLVRFSTTAGRSGVAIKANPP
jgi:hypothetical protein